ncbi:cation diffusion facilitator family transporter [Herbinix hemicellulosilytica]|uniref:Putative membrane protein n=2 Tax=Herbinix hemicellulosilytica TaxID=1564487 RepID=A0A0H5SFC5_HERHM|nr:cation diffusion facilitator family transporter [Herbinix hemicellulosilytica]RBP56988.1 cation diffusion facilitator family transporter [Herbinix hemicellulosilytica]CRZ34139.1 putative membrane protein [Herbinix hemicellulosilytica]
MTCIKQKVYTEILIYRSFGGWVYIRKISYDKIAMKVSWISIAINVLLSIFKLTAGLMANSAAMISDAVHTISDVISTFVVIIGVKMSCKEADSKHPYGHERFECVAALILSIFLFLIGGAIGYSGIKKAYKGLFTKPEMPGYLALIASVISIIVKEGLYRYAKIAAKKINSGALLADAWHHRSDALSSFGSLVGIIGARFGLYFMDPLAGVVICIMIIISSVSIFLDAIGKMTDKSCDKKILEEMVDIILQQEGVIGVDKITTRLFGNKIYVDVEIRADGSESLATTHEIAHRVHDIIEAKFENVKHCMVHVNPD